MDRKENIVYIVEGETEQQLIKTLKTKWIYSGNVIIFNMIQNIMSPIQLRTIKSDTNVVIVFDTDISKTDVLAKNISNMQQKTNISKITLIPQIKNLEDELVHATTIKQIKELLPSQSNSDFKRDFCKSQNVPKQLIAKSFDINKFWSRNAVSPFNNFKNQSEEIKK